MSPRFSLYLPPGWSRLDLNDDIEASVDRFAGLVARHAPFSRQPQVRRLVAEHLVGPAAEFAERGVSCLVLSTLPTTDEPVRPTATFTVLPADPDVDPLMLLQAVVEDDTSTSVLEVGHLVGLRTSTVADATAAAVEAEPLLRHMISDPTIPKINLEGRSSVASSAMISLRTRYTFGDPDDRGRWVDVQLALEHPDVPEAWDLAAAQVDLFDAVISTFRWEA